MRIVQIVTLVSPDGAYGGPLRVALNQCAALAERGHEVTIVGGYGGYTQAPREIEGIPARLFPTHTVIPRVGFGGLFSPALHWWMFRNRNRFDLAHVHLARDFVVMPSAAIARSLKLPILVQTHGMVTPSARLRTRPIDVIFTRRLLKESHTCFYLTEDERKDIEAVARQPIATIHLHNGIPLKPLPDREKLPPEILFLARLHPRKNPLAFVEAAKILIRAGSTALFTLVGPDEGEGPKVADAIAGFPQIRWEGAVDSGTAADRMSRASVYVLPSFREPYPMTVLEALSVGVPVVVSGDCGLANFVEANRCGTVTPPEAASLAAAISGLLESPTDAAKMGLRGRMALARTQSMDSVLEILEPAYMGAVA